jgi:hypothetical protein
VICGSRSLSPMRITLLALLLGMTSAGCGGRALAAYGELCEADEDCSSGLVCAGTRTGGVCASSCEVDADCTAHGTLAYCAVGSLACLQACEDDRDCDGDTVCMEGFCEAGEAPP